MTKWGEGLRATRSRGGRVWFPRGASGPSRRRDDAATRTPASRRPRGGASGPALADRARGASEERETYHHEAARAALLRVHRGDGAEGAAARAGRDAPQVGREAT
jgi:hypothetical protein